MPQTYAETYREVLSRIADLKPDVWPSRFSVVDQQGIFRLLRYEPMTEREYRTPILISYAWINRPYVLDLQPEISIVQKYLKAGFEVYMVDWGYPTFADKYLDMDDYADYLDKSVENVKRWNDVDNITVHGYCLGGTLSAAYTALRQENVRNLMLQAAPIAFNTKNPLALWAQSINADKLADAFHQASGELLNTGFLLADPINLIIGKYSGFLDMVHSDTGMTSFLRMDRWIFDSPAMPGELYRQYINDWYHNDLLMKGRFRMLGESVDLTRISGPLLVLAAKFDHIVPPESQKAILEKAQSPDKDVYEMAKGHIGITTSRESHKEFWPKVVNWIAQRSE